MILLTFIPIASATPAGQDPFPNITFKIFSQFITQHFSSKISLSAVLVLLFLLIKNPELLNLHARQQYVQCEGEKSTIASGWIEGLAWAVKENIDENHQKPMKMKDVDKDMNAEQEITALGLKLDAFAQLLNLHLYNKHGHLQKKLQPVSHKLLQFSYFLPTSYCG